MNTSNQPSELDYSAEAIAAVALELASMPVNPRGQNVATLIDIDGWDPRTRLILLLRALSGLTWLTDLQVFSSLKKEFYYCLNSYRGGLTREAYLRYAPGCELVKEAAECHRQYFAKAQKNRQA